MRDRLQPLFQNGFVRFIIVGVINTIIGLTVTFICLNLFAFNYWASTLIGNAFGAVNSYFMNKSFTFRSKASIGRTAWKFMAITAICYFVAYWLAAQVADKGLALLASDVSSQLKDNAAALIGSGLYTILNYVGQKKITFIDKGQVATTSQVSSLPEREESGTS